MKINEGDIQSRPAVLVVWLQGLVLPPRGGEVVVEVVPALSARVGEERHPGVQVGHEGLDGQLGVDGGLRGKSDKSFAKEELQKSTRVKGWMGFASDAIVLFSI